MKANYDVKRDICRTIKPINNEVLCLRHDLSEEKYSQRMRLAERNLKSKMFEVYGQMYEKLGEFKLMIGKGYLNEAKIGSGDFLLSQSVNKGKTFTMGVKNRDYHNLLGFKKVPIK